MQALLTSVAVAGNIPSPFDPVAHVGLAIAVLLAAAKLGGELAARLKQSAVLGELLAGVLLGNLPLGFFAELRSDPNVDLLARLGVLVLVFEVGLESTVREVAQVGRAGSAVALLGTVGSFSAGMVAARIVLVHDSWLVRAFVAASITATSIGISARVLRDLGAARTREALTILGAAVIDDVLGLLVLAIMSGVASGATQGAPVSGLSIVWLLVKTIGVLTLAIVMGVVGSPWLFALTSRFRTEGALVTTGLFFCFVLAWAASTIGLSPIVGAFTAGLVLEESHSARFVARGEPPLSDRMEPIASWLVPIFFVVIGIRADVRALANASTLALVLALGSAAIVGKLACAIGAPRGSDRIAVALGMIPRGEVTLVFANLGLSLPSGGRPLFDANIYSALVAVVVVTTIATPLALRLRLRPARSKVTHP